MTVHEQFRADMKAAGFTVSEYKGRNDWTGPAVRITRDEVPNAISATSLRVKLDDFLGDVIVYPDADSSEEVAGRIQ